jgi:hypothetical protein
VRCAPDFSAMCAGTSGSFWLNSDCQLPYGLLNTTVTVLPPLEPVIDLIWLYPEVLWGRKCLPPTSWYAGLPLSACQL